MALRFLDEPFALKVSETILVPGVGILGALRSPPCRDLVGKKDHLGLEDLVGKKAHLGLEDL